MNETIDKLKELLENDKKTIEENYKEIERLNNIINKTIAILEKYEVCYRPGELYLKDILLDILKGVDKE